VNRIIAEKRILSASALLVALAWGATARTYAQTEAARPEGTSSESATSPAAVAAEAAASPEPAATTAAAPEEPRARLDYSDGTFYLRSINDNLVLAPSGRVHIDTYGFAGRGVSDYHRANGTGLRTNLFFRRFVIEIGGMVRRKWFFWIGGNFAPTTVDGSQNPISTANVYDGFIGYLPNPRTRIYLGQYNAPFTMENTTSSRWLDLMERALTVRTLATPYNKADGLTLWGETEHKHFEYQVGVFGGDGMNRPNVDNRVDMMSRFVFRPLATRSDALKRFHVGIGARIGSRDLRFVRYDSPGLSTPGGYTFWASTYRSSVDGSTVHIRQAGAQGAMSGEFYLPFERFDVRGEVVYLHENRAEISDTTPLSSLRRGTFSGVGAYGQVSYWLAGTPRINGNPAGTYGMTRVPDSLGAQAAYGVQLVARAELIRARYDANSSRGVDDGDRSATTTHVDVNAYQLALNYWATKHIRVTGEYSLYQFPGNAMTNQAAAPGVRATPAVPGANVLHEFSVRLGLAL